MMDHDPVPLTIIYGPGTSGGITVIEPAPVKWAAREVFHWDQESIARLRQYVADGFSGSEIAALLGNGLTRNAIVGKAHRLGLHLGVGTLRDRTKNRLPVEKRTDNRIRLKIAKGEIARPKKAANGAWVHSTEKTRKPPYVPPKPVSAPKSKQVALMDLTPNACRWPGDDGPLWTFCAHDRQEGSSYCHYHENLSKRVGTQRDFDRIAAVTMRGNRMKDGTVLSE